MAMPKRRTVVMSQTPVVSMTTRLIVTVINSFDAHGNKQQMDNISA